MRPILFCALLAACGKDQQPRPAPAASALAPPWSSDAPAALAADVTGDISNADQVIAGLRPVFRGCYSDGLREDATMEGRVVFNVEVLPTGDVGPITVRTRTGRLSDPVVACLSLAIQKATFAAPMSGHAALLAVPISFVANAKPAAMSEEEKGVKRAVTTSCAAALRRRGATNEDDIAKQCECSWGILRRTFTPTEINDAKLVEDPRFAAVNAESRRVCVPGAK